MPSSHPTTVILGAGAVGCYFGGMLARAGVPVTLVGRAAHVDAINRDGLLLDGVRVHERIRLKATTDIAAVHEAGVVLFCVKSTGTGSAARDLQPHFRVGCALISMQNGVDNADRIRAETGIQAVPAVVYVAAEMTAPGCITHSARGDLILGRSPAIDAGAISAMFERAGVPCPVSEEIRTDLWTKMLMNCASNAISALTRSSYGAIARDPAARDLMRRVIEEAAAVARTEGVSLSEDVMMAAACRLGETAGDALSSTAHDIARGRLTEIDSLNGYVVMRGEAAGIPVPANQALYALVKLLEAGGAC